ncbi:MAG: Bug family tripartite tricarboxylate transporter substrate binding protein, partial [Gammaproteobacteria bacterium]
LLGAAAATLLGTGAATLLAAAPLALTGAAALAPMPAQAQQTWPDRPIKLIVPFAPGGVTDTSGRLIAEHLGKRLGQQVVVENKPGASGNIGTAQVANAPSDGYTLFFATNSPMAVAPAMRKNPPYDPIRDFTPIADIGRYTFVVVVHPSVPAKTVAELLQHAKDKPGTLNYATGNTTGIMST